jgi:hypothetical protein
MPRFTSEHFASAMADLSELTLQHQQQRQRNLSRMAALTRRLDESLYTPSEQQEPLTGKPSTQQPTPTPSEADDGDLRSLLPERTDRAAGGPYGARILERVARSYGLVE